MKARLFWRLLLHSEARSRRNVMAALPGDAPLWRVRVGQTIVIFALAIVPVFGMVGLSIDVGSIYLKFRQARSAADAGALGGARAMAVGENVTAAQVQAAIARLVQANASGTTILAEELVNNPAATSADQCLQGSPTSIPLALASPTELQTAQCLRVRVQLTFPTYFIGIVGFNSFTVQAESVAAAVPVTAMTGVMPVALYGGNALVTGASTTLWGPNWNNYVESAGCPGLLNGPNTLPQDHWRQPCDPSKGPPSYARYIPGFSSWQGLTVFAQCRRGSTPSNWFIGWDDPDHKHAGQDWDSGGYEPDPAMNMNNCSPNTPSNYMDHISYWARNGFGGVISVGDVWSRKGNFFFLAQGNLGANFKVPFGDFCNDHGGPPVTITVPVFDYMADPNHEDVISAHMAYFAAVRTSDCGGGAKMDGVVTNATVPPSRVRSASGLRRPGVSNVTVVKLVS